MDPLVLLAGIVAVVAMACFIYSVIEDDLKRAREPVRRSSSFDMESLP